MDDDQMPDDQMPGQEYDDIRAILGALTFLDPRAAASSEQMPPDAWDRLQGSLARESAERAATEHSAARTGNVVALPTVTQVTSRPSRGMRWAGGLVAASVAVVAVGLAVGSLRGTGQDVVVVAGEGQAPAPAAAQPLTAADPDAAAEAFSVPAAPSQSTRSSGPDETGAATVVPAARMVMASQTNYLPEQLRGQVVSLVKNAGFQTPEEAVAKQVPTAAMPVEGGFTASWEALRACLTWLTQSPESQALIVDRGTYAGADAGVVVAPAGTADGDSATPSPTVTVDTRYGMFDVWVVNPDCQQVQTSLDDFALYAWQP